MVEEAEGVVLRKIQTTPREHWCGHWKRGLLYPLYSVVENNGSVFIAMTGKAKDEPYVIYSKDLDDFMANDGWELRQLSADSMLTAFGLTAWRDFIAGFGEITASVSNTTGEPSVSVTTSGPNAEKNIAFAFSGIKGEQGETGVSIARVEQTGISTVDGGSNEITITLTDGRSYKVYVKNGDPGVESASATVDSLPGTPRVVTNIDSERNLSFAFYGLKGVQGNPGVNNTSMQVVEELPTASADTMDIVFLVYNETSGEYDRYITQYDGEEYSFVQIGDTSLDLDDYKRIDSEVWLTQDEFDALSVKDITKTYYIYEESDDIEAGEI